MQNTYETLGTHPDASEEEIKKAYRRAASQWHPDRNSSIDASAMFRKVQEAYELLSDPDRRKAYDDFKVTDRFDDKMFTEEAHKAIIAIFLKLAEGNNWKKIPYVGAIRRNLGESLRQNRAESATLEQKIESMKMVSPAVPEGEQDLFSDAIQAEIKKAALHLFKIRNGEKILCRAVDLLANYKDEEQLPDFNKHDWATRPTTYTIFTI